MKKKIIYSLFLVLFLFVVTACNKTKEIHPKKEGIGSVKILIDEKEYKIILEENETVQELFNQLPLELSMSELNGNEKYAYLNQKLPTNSFKPGHINAGDVMLYGNNCLVIFYKSFDTSYSYTKIGRIENLEDLGSDDVMVKIERLDIE